MRIILAEVELPCRDASFLKTTLSGAFKAEVVLLKRPLPADYEHFTEPRGQWDAEKLLEWLSGLFAKERGTFVIGLFPYDMFAGRRKQVFGVAENVGRTAIVSYHAFDPAMQGRHDDELFRRRLYKKVVHQLGHLMGIPHCSNRNCVMNQARNLMFLDRKTAEFCRKCRPLVSIG
ncbi:MAG: hypothetical protein V1787_00725 [Candidatus Micrarchaeota archaeon]